MRKEDIIKGIVNYFNGDSLAGNVLVDKYFNKDKDGNLLESTPEEFFKRFTDEIKRIEDKYPNPMSWNEIFEMFDGFKYFTLGGSPLFGVGTDSKTSLSNCFVIGSNGDADSYGSILRTDEEQIQLMKRRGGVGHDLSHLRPSGSYANNSILSGLAGSVLYAERYSNSTKEVRQGDRRGALMLTISINHPDAEKFIDSKLESGKITDANISIRITDEFMKAVKKNGFFIQKFPVDLDVTYHEGFMGMLEEGTYKVNELYNLQHHNSDEYKGCYAKVIKAKTLWNKIIKNAWQSAEPGVLFWDTIVNDSPADLYENLGFGTVSTNPCLVGDTIVAVADGRDRVSIKQLADEGNDIDVYCCNTDGDLVIRKMRNPRLTGRREKIYKVILDSGDFLRVTGNHKFYLKNGEQKQAVDLVKGDSLHILSKVKDIKFSNKKIDLVCNNECYSEHRFVYENLVGEVGDSIIHHIDENPFNNSIDNLLKCTKSEHNKVHNKVYPGEKNGNYSNITNDELKNLFVEKTREAGRRLSKGEYYKFGGVSFSSSYRKELGDSIYDFLYKIASDLFVDENLYSHDPRIIRTYQEAIENGYKTRIKNGAVIVERVCENCGNKFWALYLRREVAFCNQLCAVNHLNKKRWGKTKPEEAATAEFYNHKVVSVVEDGFEDVYNGTVDEFHNFFVGGFESKTSGGQERHTFIVNAQCGEVPLSPYDSCRLAPINLFSYVKNPFSSDSEFDFILLKNKAYKAQRIMDDMIDLELEKIDLILKKIETDPESRNIKEVEKELWMKVKRTAQAGRRTGLGITGFGDCLAALGITYGSPELLVIGEEISKTIAIASYKSSIDMAKERGCFEVFNFEKEMIGINNSTFLARIWNQLDDEYKDKWVEFGRRNIANLSIAPTGTVSLLTQTSSGIEPAFSIRYKRRRRSIDPTSINFTDENGETYQEYYVFHHKFEDWYDRNWYKLDSKLFDIDFKKPLDMYNDDEFQLLFEKSPWHKATANDVDWVSKVTLQGLVQRWVDHSISATTNIPKQTPVKTVDDIYMAAWESGCKGMTIYRDGSRSGILVTKEETKYASEIVRDAMLKCDIYNKTVLKEEWMIIVGLKNDVPYEIFAFHKLPNHIFPARLKAGFVEKTKSGVYKLVSREGDKTYEIPNIIDLIDENGQTNTRRFSIMLRHGISPKAISEDIQKYALVTSFDKSIQRVLQNYMKIENVCPECGAELTNQDGCIKCMGCGWSRC